MSRWLAIATLVLSASGVALGAEPLDLVGVCPIPSAGRSWSLVWHLGIAGIDASREVHVQKRLQGSDFDDCLIALIETDVRARASVTRLLPMAFPDNVEAAAIAVRQRWNAFGVGEAILEVMDTGKRGEHVAIVLAACATLVPLDVQQEVARALGALDKGSRPFPEILDELRGLPAEETVNAIAASIRLGDHPDTAYFALSELQGAAAYPAGFQALLAGLTSESRRVRDSASRGLGQTPEERQGEAAAALLTALAREGVPEVRQRQLQTLSKIGQPVSEEQAAPVLERFQRVAVSYNERAAAAEAMLQLLGVRRSIELFRARGPDAARAGLQAILATGETTRREDVEVLRAFAIDQLDAEDVETRRFALTMMARFVVEVSTSQERAGNLELRAVMLRRLPHETDGEIRKALALYASLIDETGNFVPPELPRGDLTPRPDP